MKISTLTKQLSELPSEANILSGSYFESTMRTRIDYTGHNGAITLSEELMERLDKYLQAPLGVYCDDAGPVSTYVLKL